MRPDLEFDVGLVEIADGDHSHQIRPVPISVELLQAVVIDVTDDLRLADRQSIGVARAFEQQRKLRVVDSLAGAKPEAPLLEDDAALLIDLAGLERDVVREVFEDEQRPVDHGRVVGRNLQFVDRFVKAGVGIDVRAEPHAERLHEGAHGVAGKVPRAVERHVLDEVRHAALVFVLEHRTGLDGEPKLGARLGLPVLPDVVAESVGERADRDQRVDRHDLVERGGPNRRWDRADCWARARPRAATIVATRSTNRRRV